MKTNEIDVFTCVGPRGSRYTELLANSMSKLSSGKFNLNFKYIANDGEKLKHPWEKVDQVNRKSCFNHPSVTHGECLNRIKRHIESEYVIICDTDVAVLLKDWDSLLIDEIKLDDQMAGIGIPFVYGGEYSYRNFPSIVFVLLKSEMLIKADTDFSPSGGTKIRKRKRWGCTSYQLKTAVEAKVMGKNKGDIILKDTGWQFPISFDLHKFKTKVLPYVKKSSSLKQEESFLFNQELIVCHMRAGSQKNRERTQIWMNNIKSYIFAKYNINS